jgi:hypothetical protein
MGPCKIRINWRCFWENTSTKEELWEFVHEGKGLNAVKKCCWPKECKCEIDKMKRLPVKVVRERARKALERY